MTPKQLEEQRERNAAVYNSARRIIDGWPEWKKRYSGLFSDDQDLHAKFADEVFNGKEKTNGTSKDA
jgi:hypothetical protein